MSAHVLLNLLNELGKRDKMRGCLLIDSQICCIKTHLCNSYTMDCSPVRGDNPRALASGLSYVQVDKHGITILYHLHQCRPRTSRDSSC